LGVGWGLVGGVWGGLVILGEYRTVFVGGLGFGLGWEERSLALFRNRFFLGWMIARFWAAKGCGLMFFWPES
jgi:hypothetical protein